VFFVGNDNKPKNRFKLEEEFKEYNDLVLEDFDETYRYIPGSEGCGGDPVGN
jgi:hypothetical protein